MLTTRYRALTVRARLGRTWRDIFVFAILGWLAAAIPALAQVTGTVAGTIRDASGAVLPGVTVTISGPTLQRQNVAVTTAADGTYRLQLVPPGTYQVVAELSGFNPQTRQNIVVVLNQQTTLDFVLPVAGVTESVQVSAEAPIVEVTRSDAHQHRDAADDRQLAAERTQFHRPDRARSRGEAGSDRLEQFVDESRSSASAPARCRTSSTERRTTTR